MGLFDLFKKKKCATCLRPAEEPLRGLDGKMYCHECYNKQMAIFTQTASRHSEGKDFYMVIEDVFFIKNHGVAITGKIQSGEIYIKDNVIINGKTYIVTGIDVFPKQVEYAKKGDNAGLHLSPVPPQSELKRGDVVTATRSTEKPADTFVCKTCKRELPEKYLHKNGTCADCFEKTVSTAAASTFVCEICKQEFPVSMRQKNNTCADCSKYMEQIEHEAKKYRPCNISSKHLDFFPEMISAIIDLDVTVAPLRSTIWANAQMAEQSGAEGFEKTVNDAFAHTGLKINEYLDKSKDAAILSKIASADEETLLKAFLAAHFYEFLMKDEYDQNLRALTLHVARELKKRGFSAEKAIAFEQLQLACNKAVKENPDAEETKALIKELGNKLLELDKIYVAYDEDFNNNFPFITPDGRIEVFSQYVIADSASGFYAKEHLGHFTMRKFKKEQIIDLLQSYQKMGILVLRLDNGACPVDIWFRDILEPLPTNIVESHSIGVKGMFLRELQYGYRIKKLDASEKGGKLEHSLTESMLTMRYNAYKEFGNGLCYTLATTPYKAGTTFYTEKALELAKKLIGLGNFPESTLIAPGDDSFAEYTEPVSLRVAQKPGQTMEQSFVCAFTGREEAEAVRKGFAQYGSDNSIIVITFDELHSHAVQCAGILVDMPTYGLELSKDELPKILECREHPGRIIVELNKGDK